MNHSLVLDELFAKYRTCQCYVDSGLLRLSNRDENWPFETEFKRGEVFRLSWTGPIVFADPSVDWRLINGETRFEVLSVEDENLFRVFNKEKLLYSRAYDSLTEALIDQGSCSGMLTLVVPSLLFGDMPKEEGFFERDFSIRDVPEVAEEIGTNLVFEIKVMDGEKLKIWVDSNFLRIVKIECVLHKETASFVRCFKLACDSVRHRKGERSAAVVRRNAIAWQREKIVYSFDFAGAW